MFKIASVKFQNAGRQYDFNAQTLELNSGDKVIVETERGRALATVIVPPREVSDDQAPQGLKSILRLATSDDLALATTNSAREKDAFHYCQKRIHERQMEMKLVRAEYAFDGSKIVFYFTADGRIDFRELVKDLAHYFHTRIEMRQIGVRDEAKLVGGLGICGRELCCCSFLTDFSPVSVKMAKEQGLALNPSKISGQCGRLLCCLSYEYETYCNHRKGMPKCGKRVSWQGKEWEVTGQNVLCRQLTLRGADGVNQTVPMDQYQSDEPVSLPTPPPAKTAETRQPAKGQDKNQDKSQREAAGQEKQGERETQDGRRSSRRRPRKTRQSGKPQEKTAEQPQKQPAEQTAKGSPAQTAEKQPDKKRRRRRRPRNPARSDQPRQGE
ncbi:MAG: hypothetical protein C0614_10205 [Desulfuromonas sp.]|nr:MAG: hypothetical protein C0614_10205 [Desulfuromonas sp.]